MFPKRRILLRPDQSVNDAPQRYTALWIQGVSALIAAAAAIVAVQSSRLSPLWAAVLLALAMLLILGLAVPALIRTGRYQWNTRRFATRLRSVWKSFRHEVDERQWLYAYLHGHSLPSLLSSLRATPTDDETRARLRPLQFATASAASLDGIGQHLVELINGPWRGVASARAMIGSFEGLIAFPESAGWIRELTSMSDGAADRKVVEEWLARYRTSLEQYGRWARDRNRELGDKVFREHF